MFASVMSMFVHFLNSEDFDVSGIPALLMQLVRGQKSAACRAHLQPRSFLLSPPCFHNSSFVTTSSMDSVVPPSMISYPTIIDCALLDAHKCLMMLLLGFPDPIFVGTKGRTLPCFAISSPMHHWKCLPAIIQTLMVRLV